MRGIFKIRRDLLDAVHDDLSRPHAYAGERVGFLACRLAPVSGGVCILGQSYLPVADEHYEDNPSVGAMMDGRAIRSALEYAYNHGTAMFHLHRHEHRGRPGFSFVDEREAALFVPDFWKVAPNLVHGALVLSWDRIYGHLWDPRTRRARPIDEYVTVGFPTTFDREMSYE